MARMGVLEQAAPRCSACRAVDVGALGENAKNNTAFFLPPKALQLCKNGVRKACSLPGAAGRVLSRFGAPCQPGLRPAGVEERESAVPVRRAVRDSASRSEGRCRAPGAEREEHTRTEDGQSER